MPEAQPSVTTTEQHPVVEKSQKVRRDPVARSQPQAGGDQQTNIMQQGGRSGTGAQENGVMWRAKSRADALPRQSGM